MNLYAQTHSQFTLVVKSVEKHDKLLTTLCHLTVKSKALCRGHDIYNSQISARKSTTNMSHTSCLHLLVLADTQTLLVPADTQTLQAFHHSTEDK